ncbi:hypothetical protein [Pseudomonas aeruginosa]|uniref:hypothetical protein n=1 Tax=Pseudomonas aeruginosa TaxID=287 RepID=UPI0014194F02
MVLILSAYIYVSSPSLPEPTKIISRSVIGGGGAIYEVLYDSGGATVPFIYRYFLMEFEADESEALRKIREIEPFLVTKSSGAVRDIHGDRADLYVSDTIYNYKSQGFFIIEGRLVPIKFNLKAVMP